MTYTHGCMRIFLAPSFLSMNHDDLFESQPLPVLYCVGTDRRGPSVNVLSVDIATELEATFVMPRVDSKCNPPL